MTDAPSLSPSADPRDAVRAKYREERAKRLRPDGSRQYRRLEGVFADLAVDPYTPVAPREPVRDHVAFAFIGGGWAGLSTGARLVEAGVADVRIVEKGGDFGGAWYWNRYPGAQCDTASMIYMPLLEETGHRPTEKYAHGPELLEHARRIGLTFGLYEKALFHTEVVSLVWEEAQARWRVETSRGDSFTADFIGIGVGPLHVPKLPGIPGIETFRGKAFHTSRWDYGYTGGDPEGAPMTKLADTRVGIIGTGATAIQCVPHLARDAGRLYVFQRTPSSVDVRANAPIDPEWFATISGPGWQRRWLENFTANQSGGQAEEDLVQDGWTDIARRIRSRIMGLPPEARTPQGMLSAFEDADFEKMEEIRARVDRIVKDPETARALKPWYRQLCKRPCFHDAYLDAFNRPNVTLVDTDGRGVDRIDERRVHAGGRAYEVDCLIYASGFEVGTEFTSRAGFDLVGEGGVRLSQAWADGMRTLHGLQTRGFPNAFFVQPTQGANLISNVPHNLTDSARTIACTVRHVRETGRRTVQPTAEAQEAWVSLLLTGMGRMLGSQDCTPGYYNNEGQDPGPAARLAVGHPAGPSAFFDHIERWRASGRFEGLEIA